MTSPPDPFDPAFLESLLRADIASLADEASVAQVGLAELAYIAIERAALLRRMATIPSDVDAALAAPEVLAAAVDFVADHALGERLGRFLATGGEERDGADPEDPWRVDEAETLFLHRDRLQAAIGELARRVSDPALRMKLARAVASLARVDVRWREHVAEFFTVMPLIERLKSRFDWRALDRKVFWWWTEIEAAFERLRAAPPSLEPHARPRAPACVNGIEGAELLCVAYARDEAFTGRKEFEEHLLRCPACRAKVDKLQRSSAPRTVERPEQVLRLAAAETEDARLAELRARLFVARMPIPGTRFSFSAAFKDPDRVRFTFHEEGVPDRTRALDGSRVAVEGSGEAEVRDGAAELSLPRERIEESLARAWRSPVRLLRPGEPPIDLALS